MTSLSLTPSLDTVTPANFHATFAVHLSGGLQLPKVDWPHVASKFYLSLDEDIDPSVDAEIPHTLSDCQRHLLGGAVTVDTVWMLVAAGEGHWHFFHCQIQT